MLMLLFFLLFLLLLVLCVLLAICAVLLVVLAVVRVAVNVVVLVVFFIVVDVVVGFLNQNHFLLDLFPVSPYIQQITTMFAVCLRRSLRTQLRCFQAHCVYAPCNMHLMYRCIPMTGSQELS